MTAVKTDTSRGKLADHPDGGNGTLGWLSWILFPDPGYLLSTCTCCAKYWVINYSTSATSSLIWGVPLLIPCLIDPPVLSVRSGS